MRRKQRRTDDEAARALLREAPVVHLATTTADGAPVVRALNAVVLGERVLFHGAVAGEKMACLGRPAVVSAHRVIASIPSYFTDARRACPATTYYRSAQAHGVLREAGDAELAAAMLEALMQKYQPEGGYTPLRADEPLYAKDLRTVRVFGLDIERIDGKASLGQDKPPEVVAQVLDGLWRRGAPGDDDAIREILDASPHAWPARFRGPADTELVVAPRGDELAQAAALLVGAAWRAGAGHADIERSLRASPVWIGARDAAGRVVGTARALTDTAWIASVHDVIVHPDVRGRGVGRALMALLLDHARVRACHAIHLATRDGQRFHAT